MVKVILQKIIYFVFTLIIFIVLWKVMSKFWDAFVPWNYKTDLLGIFVVAPLLIASSFILSSLCFKVIRSTK
ncbi:hypothetical protein BN1058_00887 [Paraliobacillus sp. PM-2]|nr:hypothetical protein BN1058_00887 [Paraliobacillus sp. PM-2]